VYDNPVFHSERGLLVVRRTDARYAETVPYELSFTAPVAVTDPSQYINDCCWGGDVIRDRLMPVVAEGYQALRTDQEDWGWFIWFRDGAIRLAIDIHCDDSPEGAFRVRITSRRKKLIGSEVVDTPELDRLREKLLRSMSAWVGSVRIERVDD
jgi:hypothetical protein